MKFPPWEIYERDENGNVIRYTGLVLELAKELGHRLNFRLIQITVHHTLLFKLNLESVKHIGKLKLLASTSSRLQTIYGEIV